MFRTGLAEVVIPFDGTRPLPCFHYFLTLTRHQPAMVMDSPSLIDGLPGAWSYYPDFISPEEASKISDGIHRMPPGKWTVLSHRRLLSLPSTLTGSAKDTLIAAPLPNFLDDPIMFRFKEKALFRESPHQAPNHVLINEYQPGQGIMPHEDGPAYHPITATVSLGGHTVFDIYGKNVQGERAAKPSWRILQEPRSLLITTGDMYKATLHGISELTVDEDLSHKSIVNWDQLGDTSPFDSGRAERRTRISLTYRDVLKVARVGGALKFMNKR